MFLRIINFVQKIQIIQTLDKNENENENDNENKNENENKYKIFF